MSLIWNGVRVEAPMKQKVSMLSRLRSRWDDREWLRMTDTDHCALALIVPAIVFGGFAGSYMRPVLGF